MNSFSRVTFEKYHVLLLVFLSQAFSKLNVLQIWFIISGRGDMSHFIGIGIFWIGLNRLLAIDLKGDVEFWITQF